MHAHTFSIMRDRERSPLPSEALWRSVVVSSGEVKKKIERDHGAKGSDASVLRPGSLI